MKEATDVISEECFDDHVIVNQDGEETFTLSTTEPNQEIHLIFELPQNISCKKYATTNCN